MLQPPRLLLSILFIMSRDNQLFLDPAICLSLMGVWFIGLGSPVRWGCGGGIVGGGGILIMSQREYCSLGVRALTDGGVGANMVGVWGSDELYSPFLPSSTPLSHRAVAASDIPSQMQTTKPSSVSPDAAFVFKGPCQAHPVIAKRGVNCCSLPALGIHRGNYLTIPHNL